MKIAYILFNDMTMLDFIGVYDAVLRLKTMNYIPELRWDLCGLTDKVSDEQGLTLLNTPGTIDADYRGEIKVIMINLSNEPQAIAPGERIAQMVIAPFVQARLEAVELLTETERGAGGFGHTGKS